MILPRRRVGACSPNTQRIASTTFDLPHPLGPTTAVIPGAKLIVVGSRKDLKPISSTLLRRITPSPPPHRRLFAGTLTSFDPVGACRPNRAKRTSRLEKHILSHRSGVNTGPQNQAKDRPGRAVKGNSGLRPSILEQLGIPIGAIDCGQKRHPLPIAAQAEHLGAERGPLGPARPSHQAHPGLFRRAPALAAVAEMAGADD